MKVCRLPVLAACALAVPAAPASALPVPVPHQVVAVGTGFVLPEIRVFQGDTLTLTNLDPQQAHDLVSRNLAGGVRVFASGPADPGTQAEVVGVSSLRPDVYPFFCSLHESMTGNLRVERAPAR